ncbi:MAG TPA: UDP-N-acetylglucosamine--N-acetylmuramyl-(pentapeptide) pyrophosphoryl-undecaprenol N-acetylglucosamine transferase, partial [Candidatus Margulisiibacteriota bacterium]|nr:UDP-N-acetylglucosamine--N-acetylmuramyl-(pentapeptide) pyrophosphoryl-undecaprenol N-acetylglucosamine transferase [Candidatus Margulisiibacteriota bacterium]
LRNVGGCFAFLKCSLQSLFILFEFRPDIVVGFGTLASVPMVFFAWLFRMKIIIHEQNVIPGKANRLMVKLADKIAISFPKTTEFLRREGKKIVLTGNPLRQELKPLNKKAALDFFRLKEGRFTILVTGGSQGSHNINMAFFKTVVAMPDKNKLQVIHLSGAGDYAMLKESYQDCGLDVRIMDFFQQMQYAYSASDLAICRSGAATISELVNFRLPAIIIPYPFAHRHQLANSALLSDAGSAIVLEEEELSVKSLGDILMKLMNNPGELSRMSCAYDKFSSHLKAASSLSDTALSLIGVRGPD